MHNDESLEARLRSLTPRTLPTAYRTRILTALQPCGAPPLRGTLRYWTVLCPLAASLLIALTGSLLLSALVPFDRNTLLPGTNRHGLPFMLLSGNANGNAALTTNPDPLIHNNVVAVIHYPAQSTNNPVLML